MGEALAAERRDWIERELGARVLSRYCATEAFKIGYFCEAAHGLPRARRPVPRAGAAARRAATRPPESPGEVVISNLVNHATVLLNYPMGDVAALRAGRAPAGAGSGCSPRCRGAVEDMLPLAAARAAPARRVVGVEGRPRRPAVPADPARRSGASSSGWRRWTRRRSRRRATARIARSCGTLLGRRRGDRGVLPRGAGPGRARAERQVPRRRIARAGRSAGRRAAAPAPRPSRAARERGLGENGRGSESDQTAKRTGPTVGRERTRPRLSRSWRR